MNIKIELPESDWVVTCECGNRSFGDSLLDALAAFAKHLTGTACRDRLG